VFTKFTNTLRTLQRRKPTPLRHGLLPHRLLQTEPRSIGLCELLVLCKRPSLFFSCTLNRYIHGGAWWSRTITASSFSLTVHDFLSSASTLSNIAGFASLNYRLSTPTPRETFQHPTHLNGVIAGLRYLQKTYEIGEKYILVGHSCGTTLAFQIPDGPGLVPPAGMLGVEGIYDLGRLRDDYKEVPMYQHFLESAFGKDEEAWKLASPTTQVSEIGFAWQKARVVALTQSNEDELVNIDQRDLMWEVIKKSDAEGRKDEKIELVGNHDEIWNEGDPETQLKVAIEEVLKLLAAG
jgi:kynurenine formamidase